MTQQPFYLILHNIRSLHNVGSLFRSADAFGVKKIFLTGYTGTPPRKEISKTALGAEHAVPWEQVKNLSALITRLKKERVTLAALELAERATPLAVYRPHFPLALIVGNEVRGIHARTLHRMDAVLKIPMMGKKESLNVSVAGGIALYALRRNW